MPRIIADLVVQLTPVSRWALAVTSAPCVVVGLVAAAVFVCARVVTSSPWARLALAGITVLMPLAPSEVLGNTANLHWYFLWLEPWILLYRSRRGLETVLLTALAGLAALIAGGPLLGLAGLVPVLAALVWVLAVGDRRRRLLVVTLLAASLAIWMAAVTVNPASGFDFAAKPPASLAAPTLSGYGVVPSMDLAAIVVVALATRRAPAIAAGRRAGTGRAVVLSLAGLAAAAVVATSFIPVTTHRSHGPELAPQVAAATRACTGRPATTPVVLRSPPHAGWSLRLDCAWLDSGQSPARPTSG